MYCIMKTPLFSEHKHTYHEPMWQGLGVGSIYLLVYHEIIRLQHSLEWMMLVTLASTPDYVVTYNYTCRTELSLSVVPYVT